MKKFSLRRLGAFGTAVCLAATLCACSNKNNNSNVVLPEEDNKVAVEVIPSDAHITQDGLDRTEIDEALNIPFAFDSYAPIVVSIEEVVMEDGTVGYKIPFGYHPYVVDESKPIPRFVEVLEINDEFKIVRGSYVTYPNVPEANLDFTGAVGVYLPYYYAWSLKTEKPKEYDAKKTEIYNNLGPAAIAYQVLDSADLIPELASQVYYADTMTR